jgi:hypothetical protein
LLNTFLFIFMFFILHPWPIEYQSAAMSVEPRKQRYQRALEDFGARPRRWRAPPVAIDHRLTNRDLGGTTTLQNFGHGQTPDQPSVNRQLAPPCLRMRALESISEAH